MNGAYLGGGAGQRVKEANVGGGSLQGKLLIIIWGLNFKYSEIIF